MLKSLNSVPCFSFSTQLLWTLVKTRLGLQILWVNGFLDLCHLFSDVGIGVRIYKGRADYIMYYKGRTVQFWGGLWTSTDHGIGRHPLFLDLMASCLDYTSVPMWVCCWIEKFSGQRQCPIYLTLHQVQAVRMALRNDGIMCCRRVAGASASGTGGAVPGSGLPSLLPPSKARDSCSCKMLGKISNNFEINLRHPTSQSHRTY